MIKNKIKKVISLLAVFLCVFSLVGCSNTTSNSSKSTKQSTSTAVIKKGDVVKIDFVGKVDGKEFDGGSSSDYVLEVGSGTFIDGFEDQLIGHKTKDNFKISVVFPEDYGVDSLNGKEAVFQTSIQKIYKEAK